MDDSHINLQRRIGCVSTGRRSSRLGQWKRLLVITTALGALTLLVWANWPSAPLPAGTEADRIIVEKGRRTLTLLRGKTVLKQYPISLGRVPVGAKEKEGDGKTPEGIYRIIAHKPDSSFHRALRVSYPDADDIERAQKQGISPGSDIMVHGIRNGLGWIGRAHRAVDWTAGCIAVTNPEIEELFAAVPDGAVIEIRP